MLPGFRAVFSRRLAGDAESFGVTRRDVMTKWVVEGRLVENGRSGSREVGCSVVVGSDRLAGVVVLCSVR
jgi:hypothetical protein